MKKLLSSLTIVLFGLVPMRGQTTIIFSAKQAYKLEANAGSNTDITSGESVTLGGNPAATGGTEPYSYSWSNGSNSVSTEANPLLTPVETTTYTLLVTDNATCTAASNSTINIGVLGINDFTEDELKVYPNPTTNKLFIQSNTDINSDLSITIYDNTGRILYSQKLEDLLANSIHEIDISAFTHGIYILQINNSKSITIKKIIKQ